MGERIGPGWQQAREAACAWCGDPEACCWSARSPVEMRLTAGAPTRRRRALVRLVVWRRSGARLLLHGGLGNLEQQLPVDLRGQAVSQVGGRSAGSHHRRTVSKEGESPSPALRHAACAQALALLTHAACRGGRRRCMEPLCLSARSGAARRSRARRAAAATVAARGWQMAAAAGRRPSRWQAMQQWPTALWRQQRCYTSCGRWRTLWRCGGEALF